jgi:AcrR family transcriptional regulator
MTESSLRRRNSAQTRADILRAAQHLFSQGGYEQIGVRDIAVEAGINSALIIRYFGSKEGLFAQSVTEAFHLGDLLQTQREEMGERLVRYLLQDNTDDTFYPILALLRSVTSAQGATLLRQGLEEHFIKPLAEWLEGDQPYLRASLIASILLGVATMQDVLYISYLTESSIESIVKQVAPVIQAYVDNTV